MQIAPPRSERLQRSRTQRLVAGVLGGIAERWDLDSYLVRTLYSLALLLTGGLPGILLYLILWWVLPEEPRPVPSIGSGSPVAG